MNINIYTCSFGSGHKKGAELIASTLSKNFKVKTYDFLKIIEPNMAEYIYEQYANIMRKQNLFLKFYLKNDSQKEKVLPLFNPFKKMFFKVLDTKAKPDVFVATYSFVAYLLSEYKKERGFNTPLITFVTDFTPHEIWINENTDLYLVTSNYTKIQMMKLGVKEDKILLIGKKTKGRKRDFLGPQNLLITGGGLGLLPEDLEFYLDLEKNFSGNIRIVCGSNEKLKNKLQRYLSDKYTVIGYADNMSEHLEWADICLSKPGGLTILEAMERGIPIAYFPPFLPQEIHNAKFLEKEKIGFNVDPSNITNKSFPNSWELIKIRNRMKELLEGPKLNLSLQIERLILDNDDYSYNCVSF